MKTISKKNWKTLSERATLFFSKYGQVNAVGQTLLKNGKVHADGDIGIFVGFQNLNKGITLKKIPISFEDFPCKIEKLGEIKPL